MRMAMEVEMNCLHLEAITQVLMTNPDANSACLVKVFVIYAIILFILGTRQLKEIWSDVRAMTVALTNF